MIAGEKVRNDKRKLETMRKTERAIERFLNKVERNSYAFHAEGDLTCWLYEELSKEYPKIVSSKYGKTCLVHSQLPQSTEEKGKFYKIDLVVVDDEEAKSVDQKGWLGITDDKKRTGYRWPELQAAIEIKFGTGTDKERGLRNDIKKLKKIRENSSKKPNLYLIYVFRHPSPMPKWIKAVHSYTEHISKECEKDGIYFRFIGVVKKTVVRKLDDFEKLKTQPS